MGDFQLRRPTLRYRGAPSPNLGVGRLQLDPGLAAEIQALRSAPPTPRLRDLVLRPNWRALEESRLNALIAQPPAAPRPPLVPRGAGPATPRPGARGDILNAVWRVPAVQQAANHVLDEAGNRFRRDWNRLGTGGQIAVVTQAGVIAGGALAGALSNPDSRAVLFDFIIDRPIPVPGVDGLELRVLERGGGASFANIGGSGVSASARGNATATGRFEGGFEITLDLTRWIPALR